MPDHAGQVNRRFHAGVAAADHRHVLALEQRAVAVRAVGHALGLVLLLARHVDVAPACAGGQDHGAALQLAAVVEFDGDVAAGLRRRHQLGHALGVHDVHVVVAHVLLQRGGVVRAVGFGHAGVVGDFHGVVHLAAEALGHHAGADALARRVDGGRGAGRAAADDQHLIRRLGAELGSVAPGGAGVDLAQDLFQRGTAAVEHPAAFIDGGHAHDLALFDFLLEHAAIDHRGGHARVDDGQQAEGLHHVRAVVARQAHVDLEVELGVQRLGLGQHVVLDLGRMAARPQQRQHQRGELVAERDGGEAQARRAARLLQREGGHAGVLAVGAQGDLVAQAGDQLEQFAHFLRLVVAAQGGHQFERLFHALEVSGQLLLEVVVQHGGILLIC